MAEIFFKSPKHKERFEEIVQKLGKVYNGKFDQEYGAALYILTADLATWQKAQGYVDSDGIDFSTMFKEVDFSGGYSVLINLAEDLFNGRGNTNVVDIPTRLDDSNFNVALIAIGIRRYGYTGE